MVRREIGGGKWISFDRIEEYIKQTVQGTVQFISNDEQQISTCRSAIRAILSSIRKERRIALLPAFTCSTVVDPFVEQGYGIHVYNVDKQFTTTEKDFDLSVTTINPSVILFHSLFGFNTCRLSQQQIDRYRAKGIVVIEDYTPCLLSSFERLNVDFRIGSIRKWFPVPDGAIVSGLNRFSNLVEDSDLVEAKIAAFTEKANYLSGSPSIKSEFLKLFKRAEELLDTRTDIYSMSDISRKIILNSNIKLISNRRRENYFKLLNGIRNSRYLSVPIQSSEPTEVPFFFPILCKERKTIQNLLAKKDIYATILWSKPKQYDSILSMNEQEIYDEILCIPCSESYSLSDMDYIIKSINDITL